jgi:8-oxo-dGTP pyrophosphatase MutT (NUDIX family)
LCIFRRGKWDLPKGKMEQHETAEICAAREIEEETGVNQLTLHHKLTDTYHVYEERGLQILKISHWFYFTTNFNGAVHPQLEEDITAIKWFSLAEFEDVASKNTFDAIQDVVDTYKRSVLPFI